jgi:putative aldouronate transport system substrate-binding protein
MADKYGITAINTLKDYDSFLSKIKENEKEVLPGLIAGGDAYDISFYANSYGYAILDYSQNLVYKWDDPDMKIIPWEQTPEFKETTGFVNSWFKNGYMEKEAVQGTKVASFICKTGSLSEGAQNIDFYSDGNQEIYNLYILYKDKKIQRGSPLNDSPFGVVAFNSNSENTERALMFLNWIQSTQENYDLFNYGIKDRHYTLKGERIDMPEGMTPDSNPYWWHGFDNELLNYAFMNINFNRLSVYDTVKDNYKSDYLQFVKTNTSYAPHEGFYPDYANIKDDCLKRMQLYGLEVKDAFQSGTFDINKTDSIIEDLNGAGTGRIVNEIQKQLNHWRSVNKK